MRYFVVVLSDRDLLVGLSAICITICPFFRALIFWLFAMAPTYRKAFLLFFMLALLLQTASLRAEQLAGRCVGVSDGDTVTLLINGRGERIRLYGIDCPEKTQPFGQRAKQYASSLMFGKVVTLERADVDRYGRTIGRLYVDGKYVNAEMIRAGFAWHYKQYSSDRDLAALELDARRARRGLWADQQPVPPWEFRRAGKRGFATSGSSGTRGQSAAASAEGAIHGNVSSRVFHRQGCKHYDCANCTAVFASRAAAISAGYRPCGWCRP